jgi:hypothetical protein
VFHSTKVVINLSVRLLTDGLFQCCGSFANFFGLNLLLGIDASADRFILADNRSATSHLDRFLVNEAWKLNRVTGWMLIHPLKANDARDVCMNRYGKQSVLTQTCTRSVDAF